MSVETDIRRRLVADGTVSGLVGTRIYALVLPQDPTYPAVTYQRISGPRLQDLAGSAGRGMARIQIDSWSREYIQAQSIAAAIRGSLNGFIGDLGDGASPESFRDVVIRLANERDLYEDEDAPLYRVTQDFTVDHSE